MSLSGGFALHDGKVYAMEVCILTISHSPEAIRGRASPAAAGLRYRLPARLPLARVRHSSEEL
jgi:hypothetical protein